MNTVAKLMDHICSYCEKVKMCSLVMIFDKGQKTARTKFICKDCNPEGHAEDTSMWSL
jgi:hypothetical protein